MWNPAITWTKKYAVFVTLESETGVIGVGECWCFDSSPDVLVAYLRTEICPLLIGSNGADCSKLYKRLLSRATLTARHGLLASAWSGIDIALWDLKSRESKLPLWKFISQTNVGKSNDSNGQVKVYGSGGLYGKEKNTSDLADEMRAISNIGFDIVKMKIGGLSITEDVERINSVLHALDSRCKLIIDGVYSYSGEQALEIFNSLPTDRVEAFQSPVAAQDHVSMKSLMDAGVPVMAIEAEYRTELHKKLVETGAVKFLQLAPVACGGIGRLNEIGVQLVNTEVELSLEVSSTAIALLAACHYAAAVRTVAHVEYHFVHQVFFEDLDLSSPDGGWLTLPDKPGLGMELRNTDTVFELKK